MQCRLNEDVAVNAAGTSWLDSKVVQIDIHEEIARESGFDSYEEWIAARAETV